MAGFRSSQRARHGKILFILALKVFLTPILIAAASLVQRRLGGLVGGLVAGLPLTSAPISVLLAIQYGHQFAATAAIGTLLGVVAMSGFCAAYVRCASRFGWAPSLALAAAACGLIAFAMAMVPPRLELAAALTFPLLLLLVVIIGPPSTAATTLRAPWWDIPARMLVAAAAVLLITGFARVVGPRWSGLLSTMPIFAAVMGVFSHRHGGAAAAHAVLRGIAVGALGAATFFLTVGVMLERLGTALTYSVAVTACVAVAGLTHMLVRSHARANEALQPEF